MKTTASKYAKMLISKMIQLIVTQNSQDIINLPLSIVNFNRKFSFPEVYILQLSPEEDSPWFSFVEIIVLEYATVAKPDIPR